MFLVLSAYVFLSAVWAADPAAAFSKGAVLLGTVVIAYAAGSAAPLLEEWQLRRTALAFAAGAFAGALFLIVELRTSGFITRIALNATHVLDTPTRAHVVDGNVVAIQLGAFRQNAGLVLLHLWPALLAYAVIAKRVRRTMSAALLFLAPAAVAFLSDRQSAELAVLASLLAFTLAMIWRRNLVRALAAFWCLAFVVVLPVSFSACNADLHMATWLDQSARIRVIIWQYTAERALEHPWFGIGADSTRAI